MKKEISPYVVPGLKYEPFAFKTDIDKPQVIIDTVLGYRKQTKEKVFTKCRKREFAYTRQLLMYLLKKLTPLSLREIGLMIDNRDHTTVIHARDTISDLIDTDPSVVEDIERICQLL